jgi:DNA-binding response OmpR family regulator
MIKSNEPYKILIVEDEPAIRESLAEMLEIKNYLVIVAKNGIDGLKAVHEQNPDLIISDVMMPEMDGFEFLKEIRSNSATSLIPIIMLTAKIELESRLHGLELGADDYLTKPFEFRELQLKIHNLLFSRAKLVNKLSPNLGQQDFFSQDELFLKKLNLLLENRIEDSKLRTDELAIQLHMSLSTFNRRIKNVIGKSPNQYLREFRLKRARAMIRLNYGNLSEIAGKTGFSSLSYFSTSYKQYFGENPKDAFVEK